MEAATHFLKAAEYPSKSGIVRDIALFFKDLQYLTGSGEVRRCKKLHTGG